MLYIIPVILLLVVAAAFFTFSTGASTSQASDTQTPKVVVADKTKRVETVDKSTSKQYSGKATYLTPRREKHDVGVTLSLDGTTITDATVSYNGGDPETRSQRDFNKAYKDEVIGKNIEEISLSRVGGASLTTGAFNKAVEEIRKQL